MVNNIANVQWNRPDPYVFDVAEGAQADVLRTSTDLPNSKLEYDSRAQFYFAYSSLVLYSFGLENAIEVNTHIAGKRLG